MVTTVTIFKITETETIRCFIRNLILDKLYCYVIQQKRLQDNYLFHFSRKSQRKLALVRNTTADREALTNLKFEIVI